VAPELEWKAVSGNAITAVDTGFSFQHPFAVLFNFAVHGIRGNINLAWPCHYPKLKMRLVEQSRIAQGCKNAGIVREDEARHVNQTFHAVKETDAKLMAGEGHNFGKAP
jgi:hypothetical protein